MAEVTPDQLIARFYMALHDRAPTPADVARIAQKLERVAAYPLLYIWQVRRNRTYEQLVAWLHLTLDWGGRPSDDDITELWQYSGRAAEANRDTQHLFYRQRNLWAEAHPLVEPSASEELRFDDTEQPYDLIDDA